MLNRREFLQGLAAALTRTAMGRVAPQEVMPEPQVTQEPSQQVTQYREPDALTNQGEWHLDMWNESAFCPWGEGFPVEHRRPSWAATLTLGIPIMPGVECPLRIAIGGVVYSGDAIVTSVAYLADGSYSVRVDGKGPLTVTYVEGG